MKFYLDSANLEEIKKAVEGFPIAGVTTNPTILARTGNDNPAALLRKIRTLTEGKTLFVQITEEDPTRAYQEAQVVRHGLGGDVCIKIPMNAQNVSLIRKLTDGKIRVCATAVYTLPQAIMAAEAGADFVAPYVSHLDAIPVDGPALAAEMQKTLREYGYKTQVLGASFRVLSQIDRMMSEGVAAVTVTYDMLEKIASSAGSDAELASFGKNWENAYGDKKLRDFF